MTERTTVKERTRQALLLAGIEVLSRDPSAPLGEVAARAGVARSTLHRYFPDRQALFAAIFALASEEYEAALDKARPEAGRGLDAFRRLCIELVERLEILMWWMQPTDPPDPHCPPGADGPGDATGASPTGAAASTEPPTSEGSAAGQDADGSSADDPDQRIAAIVARGHEDGSIDPAVNAPWVEQLLWATLYVTAQAPNTTSLSGFEARSQALRTLLKAVAADPTDVMNL